VKWSRVGFGIGLVLVVATSGVFFTRRDDAAPEATGSVPSQKRQVEDDRFVRDTLQAASTDVWVIRLSGMQRSRVHVIAVKRARLVCRLVDQTGGTVPIKATRNGCDRVWIPDRTGAYRIEIGNLDTTVVPYSMRIEN
jgi:hypothetical protein